jgi:hypothetical protein
MSQTWLCYFYAGERFSEYDYRSISSDGLPEGALAELQEAELKSYADRIIAGDLQSKFLNRVGPELTEFFRKGADPLECWDEVMNRLRESIVQRLKDGLLFEVRTVDKDGGPTTGGNTYAERDAALKRRKAECELCRGPFLREES